MKPSTASPPHRPARRRWLAWLSPLTLLLCVGCAKEAAFSTSAPEQDYGYGGELPPATMVDVTGVAANGYDDGGYDEYDFEGDLAEESMARETIAAAPPPGENPRASLEFRKSMRTEAPAKNDAKGKAKDKDKAKAETKVGGRNSPGGSDGDEAKPAEPSDDQDQPDHGRQIIYIAGLQISVYDLEAGMATVESIPDRYGGWVHMRSQNQVVLRIPADQLEPVMRELSGIGVVEARSLQAQDVTAEYVDLESRIKVLRETQTQLLDLLSKAKTVEEALHVRNALDNVTMELEVALGRMRQLSDLIAFSTLTVTLIERGPQDSLPTSNDPFRWVDELGVEATEWR